MSAMQKLAIFGGTFDPVHWGHLLIAQTALTQCGIDRAIWIPSGCPPHKSVTSMSSLEHRCEMVRRAIAHNPAFVLESSNGEIAGASYAIETLKHLQALYPNTHWYWILGLDAFQTLPRWYRRQELIPACDWLVAPRLDPGFGTDLGALKRLLRTAALKRLLRTERAQLDGIANPMHFLCQQVEQQLLSQSIPIRWSILSMPPFPISSSLIRHYCRQNRSIRGLVPEAVRVYIAQEKLYQSDRA
ncbi:nicotinate (nicotinamide) nucleotide adenylyltransferase [Microseira sp. BLCC-F43]|jgi:nicotinate-nucleotide adenylyltransferase|uniref:nicotinate (nicotinamide) nucleotide adenylyltransferase n=1 Tax=Microseira sp. BLCC-F43 TaxID=3153602 RepID=UPI0035BBB714